MSEPRATEELRRQGLRLEWATNVWNAMEVVVTVSLGVRAGSLALVAFGLDSVVEIFASTVVIGSLRDERRDPGDRRTHRSLRLIAAAFWFLAAFLTVMSVRGLVRGDRADDSPFAVVYLAVTAFVMFALARRKHAIVRAAGSETLDAEASMTTLDGWLSTGVLTALLLDAMLGWWWSDAAAALLVAGFALGEGVGHWRESAPHEDGSESGA